MSGVDGGPRDPITLQSRAQGREGWGRATGPTGDYINFYRGPIVLLLLIRWTGMSRRGSSLPNTHSDLPPSTLGLLDTKRTQTSVHSTRVGKK